MSASGGDTGTGLAPEKGWVDRTVAEDFPELRVLSAAVRATPGRSPRALRRRLADLSSRWYGGRAISVRSEPVPSAYRAFLRQVGIDPDGDEQRGPLEQAMLARVMRGGFPSRGRVDDALLIALVETGVPVWALDDDRLDGALGVRPARGGERLGRGEYAPDLPAGRLVLADSAEAVAVVFGDVAPERLPHRETTTVRLVAIQVAGVPEIHVEEALWMSADALVRS